jgi:uncharacterized protein
VSASHWELLDWRRRVAELYARVRGGYTTDPAEAHDVWRRGRDELFATHPCTPLPPSARPGFTGLEVAAYDPAYAFAVDVDTDVTPRRFAVASGTGEEFTYQVIGVVHLPVGELQVLWLDDYAGGVFLPFADATNGVDSYGAGRYLLDTPKGADLGGDGQGRLVVDLNFAYHPSCAYDPAYSCPLPPPDNRLEAAVPVGERWRPDPG